MTDKPELQEPLEDEELENEPEAEPSPSTEPNRPLVSRKTEAELKKLARDAVTKQVFLTNDPDIADMSFAMVFAFMSQEAYSFREAVRRLPFGSPKTAGDARRPVAVNIRVSVA